MSPLVTTPVDPQYRLFFFSHNHKQGIERLLKFEVKKQNCHETSQSSHFPQVQLNNPKTQLSTNNVPNDFCRSNPRMKQNQVHPLTKAINKI